MSPVATVLLANHPPPGGGHDQSGCANQLAAVVAEIPQQWGAGEPSSRCRPRRLCSSRTSGSNVGGHDQSPRANQAICVVARTNVTKQGTHK